MSLVNNIHSYPSHSHFPQLPPLSAKASLRSGLVSQSVEQWMIKSGGRGFDSSRVQRFFSFPRTISHFLIRANAEWEIHGCTLALQHTPQNYFSEPSFKNKLLHNHPSVRSKLQNYLFFLLYSGLMRSNVM